MTDLIDRAALIDSMDRVLRNMEADMLAAGNGAYIRGYRAAINDVVLASSVGDPAAHRARQMNAELPQATRDVFAVKGMI